MSKVAEWVVLLAAAMALAVVASSGSEPAESDPWIGKSRSD